MSLLVRIHIFLLACGHWVCGEPISYRDKHRDRSDELSRKSLALLRWQPALSQARARRDRSALASSLLAVSNGGLGRHVIHEQPLTRRSSNTQQYRWNHEIARQHVEADKGNLHRVSVAPRMVDLDDVFAAIDKAKDVAQAEQQTPDPIDEAKDVAQAEQQTPDPIDKAKDVAQAEQQTPDPRRETEPVKWNFSAWTVDESSSNSSSPSDAVAKTGQIESEGELEYYFSCHRCHAIYPVEEKAKSSYARLLVQCASCGNKFHVSGAAIARMPSDVELIDYPSVLQERVREKKQVSHYKVFVRNIPYDTNEEELKTFFTENFGPIENAFLLRNDDDTLKGNGFITFESWLDGYRAIKMAEEGLMFHGRDIKVVEADRQERRSRPPQRRN